jgi:creatinine amidohydrolase
MGGRPAGKSAMERSIPLPRRQWLDMTSEDFSAPEVREWIAVLPIAAVEQHGPHLPVGVDAMIMQGYLDRLVPEIPAELPVTFLPLQAIGKSNEHLAFKGTLTLSAETASRMWIEIGESVHRAGLRKLVIVNSHGGNMAAMDIVARELRVRHGMLVAFTSWHLFGYPDGLFADDEMRLGIHAGEIETSLMLDFRPDLVRLDRAEDFRPVTYAMERSLSKLRTGRPAGFGWMAQDLHPSGAAGNAAAATANKGSASARHGVAAFVSLLRDVAMFELDGFTGSPPSAK